MISKISVLAVLGCLSIVSAGDLKLGVAGGMGLSSIIGENPLDKDGEIIGAWSLGFTGRVGFGPIAFQPEVLYSAKGVAITALGGKPIEDLGMESLGQRTTYLDVNFPLALGVLPKFDVLFGPQIGILISADGHYTPIAGDEVVSDRKDVNNPIDLGFLLGLQFEVIDGLYFGARGTIGVLNINNKDKTYYSRMNQNIFGAPEGEAKVTPGDDSYNVNLTSKVMLSYMF
ncbi:PorT family protein [Fibrobacterales bacterium]|nr:PorT family protein [Fibrobacterales bacterium]